MAGDEGSERYDDAEPTERAPGAPAPGPGPGYPPPRYPQAPAYGPSGSGLPSYSQPGMLTSAADRERATDLVKAAFGEGRLGKEEFDSRCARALSARTYHDLALVVADLPGGSAFLPPAPSVIPAPGAALIPTTYAAYPAMPTSPQGSGMAIGSVVCGLLGIFPTFGLAGIPAVILGHAALGEIRRTGKSGHGAATAGLVIGYLAMGFWALMIVLGVVVGR